MHLRSAGTFPEAPSTPSQSKTPSQNKSCAPPSFPPPLSQQQRIESNKERPPTLLSDKIVENGGHVSAKMDSAESTGLAGGGEGGGRSCSALLVSQNVKMISGLVATLESVASPQDLTVHMQHLEDTCNRMHCLVQRARCKEKGLSAAPPPPARPPARFFFFLSHSIPLTAHLSLHTSCFRAWTTTRT